MDNKAVRKRNIELLVAQSGGPTEFARTIGREQVQVSQWLGGKNIGDRLARDIEAKLGKDSGWLDSPQWASASSDSGNSTATEVTPSQPERLDDEKLAASIEWLQGLFNTWRRDFDPVKHARLIAAVYAELTTPAKPNLVRLSLAIAEELDQESEQNDRQSKARRA
ncbi:hypothetical protein [Lysobacter capsici]|uniref:hypothetical protein n=1 Tax=Lysobacter capsici TaxID=435897 RepID=UPI001C002CCD|nr:hypothetical protein [Lysobacter capsici]QWF19273.1 hypothetical protein KME82_11300 [Lysobacter capsici]